LGVLLRRLPGRLRDAPGRFGASGSSCRIAASQSIQIPFFAEQDHQCGPAALAMVLDATGDTVTPQQLVGSVFIPAREVRCRLKCSPPRAGMGAWP